MLVAASAADADDDPLARAQALIEAGKPAEAYALLEPLEASYAGEPAFDYLYGVAALDSGQALRAVFALERVVDTKPDHGPALRAHQIVGGHADGPSEPGGLSHQLVERVNFRGPADAVHRLHILFALEHLHAERQGAKF